MDKIEYIYDCAICGRRMKQNTISPFHAPQIGHTVWDCPEMHTTIWVIVNKAE